MIIFYTHQQQQQAANQQTNHSTNINFGEFRNINFSPKAPNRIETKFGYSIHNEKNQLIFRFFTLLLTLFHPLLYIVIII